MQMSIHAMVGFPSLIDNGTSFILYFYLQVQSQSRTHLRKNKKSLW